MQANPQAESRPRRGGHKSLALAALAVLNAALLLSLAGKFLPERTAQAQGQQRPSEYLIIPSRPIGLNQDVLYIMDTQTAVMVVAAFDQTRNRLDFAGPLAINDLR